MTKLLLLVSLLVLSFSFQIHTENIETTNDFLTNNYPIRSVYIDHSEFWYGNKIALALGVPGYAPANLYNYVMLGFWNCEDVPTDVALVWLNAYHYFDRGNDFGSDTQSIQKNIKKRFNDAGIKLMISAFGSSEYPTS
eukprot:TRINITY_DN32280_c0_g1_i1.p1 TRINITY_DN32280_c0_g1~~TRINITY_DN32280_c0_g1_i1.p1  ORF type:complete len:138 (-),score=3.54 TRINITY_DN32280_c0_g1_i1:656-1069(-)